MRFPWAAVAMGFMSSTAGTAGAEPVDGGTRVAVAAGWQLIPNARFLAQASESGHPLAGPSPGGPSIVSTFAYRPRLDTEVSVELGFAFERFRFSDGTAMEVSHLPLLLMTRWSPIVGPITAYVGVGGGYVLNFASGSPVGPVETHGAGPFLAVGALFDLSARLAFVAEYRIGFARVELPGVGFFNSVGSNLLVGVHVAFPPEDNRLR
jgi:hypothetical protein